MLLDVTGDWQNWLTLSPRAIAFTYFVTRGLNFPSSASMFLNLRIRYSDGSMSPELWYYLSRFSTSFPSRGSSGVTINVHQDSRILGSSQPRIIQVKAYVKRWAVEQSSARLTMNFEDAKRLSSYYILDGYTIDKSIII